MPHFNLPWKGSPRCQPKIGFSSRPEADTNTADRASKEALHVPLSESFGRVRRKQRQISRSRHGVRVSRLLPTQDSRTLKPSEGYETRYSLMQVSDFLDHPYWSTLSLTNSTPSKQKPTGASEGKLHPEYAHVRALDGSVSPRGGQMKAGIALHQLKPQHSRSTRKSHARYPKKRFGLSDPVLWDVIHRTLAQQQRLSALVERNLKMEESGRPSIPSRTSSQRRALNHFTRQLEKYADAAGARGRQPILTPTESDAETSLHTVKPLLPYIHEFEAAGLAVTSEQQKFAGRSRKGEFDGQDDPPSPSSTFSSDSVIEFTPPNGTSHALPVSEKETKHQGESRLP
jgi:hypothetical protein